MQFLSLHSLSGKNYLSTLQTEELYRFIGHYKFVIAYENSVCEDYISEKIWRPLTLGVVPIYFGSPSIQVNFIKLILLINISYFLNFI